ncbi:MAG: hypothetical protein [Cotesia congregata filamentous virus 2]
MNIMLTNLQIKSFIKKNKIRIYQTSMLLLDLTNNNPIIYSFIIDCILRNDNEKLSHVPWDLYVLVKHDFYKIISNNIDLVKCIAKCYLNQYIRDNEILKVTYLNKPRKLEKYINDIILNRHSILLSTPLQCIMEKNNEQRYNNNDDTNKMYETRATLLKQYKHLFERLYTLCFKECSRICYVSKIHRNL